MPNDPADHDDDDLLALRMSEGDKEALRRVLELHGGKVKAILTKRFGSVLQSAELDVAINAAAYSMWKAAARFDSRRGSIAGWFLMIAQRKALDIIEKEKTHQEHFCQPSEDFDPPELLPPEDGDDALPKDRRNLSRLKQIRWFVENKLVGLQRAIILADLASPSGQADSHRLAAEFGRAVNNIEVSRNKARKNLMTLMTEWDSQQERLRGKK